jgi:hypothetical protein
MKLNNKATHASSTEEFALTDTELETVLGGQGWDCTPPYGGGSPSYGSPYYGGGSPSYGGGSPSCGGNSSYAPNYGSYGPSTSPSDSGNVGYSVTTTTTTYYSGAPASSSNCGGSY